MLSNCSFSPPGGRADPFSCGSLFSPKRNRGGRTLHRGQAREAVAGAGNVPIHRGRGYQASGQGRKLTHGSFACFDSCRLWYTNWTLSGHFLDGQASEEQTSGRSWGSCAQCKWTSQTEDVANVYFWSDDVNVFFYVLLAFPGGACTWYCHSNKKYKAEPRPVQEHPDVRPARHGQNSLC